MTGIIIPRKRGFLKVATGPMRSEKTLDMILDYEKYKIFERDVLVYIPSKDLRDAPYIKSRALGNRVEGELKIKGVVYESSVQIKEHVDAYIKENRKGYKSGDRLRLNVMISEAQFWDAALINVVQYLQEIGVNVHTSGLDTNFTGAAFKILGSDVSMNDLASLADDWQRKTSLCERRLNDGYQCLRPAERTQRYVDDERTKFSHFDDEVYLPGDKKYEVVCKEHHIVPGRPFSLNNS